MTRAFHLHHHNININLGEKGRSTRGGWTEQRRSSKGVSGREAWRHRDVVVVEESCNAEKSLVKRAHYSENYPSGIVLHEYVQVGRWLRFFPRCSSYPRLLVIYAWNTGCVRIRP